MRHDSKNNVLKHWPLWGTVFVFLSALGILLFLSLRETEGHLIYALDDAYIHMAIAKNIAQHGVWGVTPYEFSSSSSSPIWTLMLAGLFSLFGVQEFFPFLLNIIFGIGIIVLMYFFIKREFRSPVVLFFFLVFSIFSIPLPALVFSGMEHLLHGLVTLLLVFSASRYIASKGDIKKNNFLSNSLSRNKIFIFLILFSFVTPLVRYETLFVIGVIAFIFFTQRMFLPAVIMLFLATLSVTIFGVFSVWQGGFFLPNPLLVKGGAGVGDLAYHIDALGRLIFNPHLLSLSLLLLIVTVRFRHSLVRAYSWSLFPAISLGAMFGHLALASTGWFFRYEAYLVLLLLVSLAPISETSLTVMYSSFRSYSTLKFWKKMILVVLLLVPLLQRSFFSLKNTPIATKNIYEQHYQLGQFLHEYYSGKKVALNDIGAATYFADIHIIDLAGLGSRETALLHLKNDFSQEKIVKLLRNEQVDLIISHDALLRACFHFQYLTRENSMCQFPNNWPLMGSWTILSNVISVSNTVSFYALDQSREDYAQQSLKSFVPYLPSTVSQQGKYLNN